MFLTFYLLSLDRLNYKSLYNIERFNIISHIQLVSPNFFTTKSKKKESSRKSQFNYVPTKNVIKFSFRNDDAGNNFWISVQANEEHYHGNVRSLDTTIIYCDHYRRANERERLGNRGRKRKRQRQGEVTYAELLQHGAQIVTVGIYRESCTVCAVEHVLHGLDSGAIITDVWVPTRTWLFPNIPYLLA